MDIKITWVRAQIQVQVSRFQLSEVFTLRPEVEIRGC